MRFLRKQMKLSQEALAERVGLNRGNISSYEKGSAEPRLDKLAEISRFFHVPVLFMIERDIESDGGMQVTDILKQGASQHDLDILIKKLSHKAEEIEHIVKGFEEYHKMKMASIKDPDPNLRRLAVDFEELLEVNAVLLEQHKTLLGILLKSI